MPWWQCFVSVGPRKPRRLTEKGASSGLRDWRAPGRRCAQNLKKAILEANASGRRLTGDEKVLMCLEGYLSGPRGLNRTLAALNSIGSSKRELDTNLMEVLGWWELLDAHGEAIPDELEVAAQAALEVCRGALDHLENPLPRLLR